MEKHDPEGYFSNNRVIWGLIIIILGIILLLHQLDALDLGRFFHDYWPLLLIFLGLHLIFRKPRHRKFRSDVVGDKDILCDSNEAYYSNVFGDMDVTIAAEDFQTGKVNNVFGDARVDLENLNIISGEKQLYLSGIFGDIKIIAPKKVPFFIKANLVAGDIEIMGEKRSGFSIEKTYKSEGYDNVLNRLNIYVSHVFGDIKIR